MPLLRHTQACLDAAQKWPPADPRSAGLIPGGPKSVTVFESQFFERIFAQAHVATPLLWFGPVLVFAAYRTAKADLEAQLLAVPLFIAGLLAWSLIEYVLHRFIFHAGAHTAPERLRAFLMHGYHHMYPNDKMRLVAPPLMSWPVGVVIGVVARWSLGPEHWLPFFAGTTVGYLLYDYTHYYTHHFRPKQGIGKWLRSYHMLHHHDSRASRFGVSSPLWDLVFGTYQPVRRAVGATVTNQPHDASAE